jgi:phosphomevalonate kinase
MHHQWWQHGVFVSSKRLVRRLKRNVFNQFNYEMQKQVFMNLQNRSFALHSSILNQMQLLTKRYDDLSHQLSW